MKNQDQLIDAIVNDRIPSGLNRRSFLKRLGGGLTVAMSIGTYGALQGCADSSAAEQEDFNAYLQIKEDGRVNCLVGKVEMGQSVRTSLKQLLAEELDIDLEQVDIIMGDTKLCPYDAGTWGSLSIRSFGPNLRKAAAQARIALLEMAAKHFKVEQAELDAGQGEIWIKKQDEKKVTYAELLKGQTLIQSAKGDVQVKDASQFSVIGESVMRHDAVEKITGEAKYAADMQPVGLLYASILRPPDHRASLTAVDTSDSERIEGVELVNEEGIVAALSEDAELALEANSSFKATWDYPDSSVDHETIFDHLLATGKRSKVIEEEKGAIASEEGDVKVDATYHDGYKAHAPIEPHAATAMMVGDELHVWASSQTPFGSRKAIAEALDMKEEKIHVKEIYIGGGFGGKIYNPQVIEAAKLAKITGRPIQVAYTRKEEFFYDYFRPAAVVKSTATASKEGLIKDWKYDVYYAGARGSQFFYNAGSKQVRTFSDAKEGEKAHAFKTGAWRAPANNTNTFSRESTIDDLATKLGIDPLEFRLKNLSEEKMIRTLKLAADKFGWEPIKGPSGKGWGIACGFDAGTWVALIAEVEVDTSTGHVQVKRCVCAQDMGLVVNPHGATIQVEGGITMGLGYALTEDIEFKGGDIVSKNFDDYHITTFSMTPKIETYFIDDPTADPQGGGEPAIITAGGAVANAIHDACGARVQRMPMTPERVLAALQKV